MDHPWLIEKSAPLLNDFGVTDVIRGLNVVTESRVKLFNSFPNR
jgi:hypothetical protein